MSRYTKEGNMFNVTLHKGRKYVQCHVAQRKEICSVSRYTKEGNMFNVTLHKGRKYVQCHVTQRKEICSMSRYTKEGNMFNVTLHKGRKYVQCHVTQRKSQPQIKEGMSRRNLLLSLAILFTGNTYIRVIEIIRIAKVFCFSERLYEIKYKALFPAV